MLADRHCQLDIETFLGNWEDVLSGAKATGVGVLFTDGLTCAPGFAELFPRVHCSLGVHPHVVANREACTAQFLIKFSNVLRIIARGETGPKGICEYSCRENQKKSFRACFAVAGETGLPVVLHNRNSNTDLKANFRRKTGSGWILSALGYFRATSGSE